MFCWQIDSYLTWHGECTGLRLMRNEWLTQMAMTMSRELFTQARTRAFQRRSILQLEVHSSCCCSSRTTNPFYTRCFTYCFQEDSLQLHDEDDRDSIVIDDLHGQVDQKAQPTRNLLASERFERPQWKEVEVSNLSYWLHCRFS